MKKTLSLFLAMLMLISVFNASVFAAPPVAEVGQNNIPNYTEFVFTPDTSGWYTFESYDNIDYGLDPCIFINEVDNEDDYLCDDDNGYYEEFRLYVYLVEDVTYACYITDYLDSCGDICFDVTYIGEEYDDAYDSDLDGDDYGDDYEDYGVTSIEFTPAQPLVATQFVDGDYFECSCDNCKDGWFFYYDIYSLLETEGNVITAYFDDGTSKDYIYTEDEYGFYSEDGDAIGYYDVYTEQYDHHWNVGESYEITISSMGKATTATVEIKPLGVESVTLNGDNHFYVIENYTGEYYSDSSDEMYFHYYYDYNGVAAPGQSVTVEFDDGEKKDFTCGYDSVFYNADFGYYLPWMVMDTQYTDHWKLGGVYDASLLIFGETIKIKVEVIDNPVESISLTTSNPIQLIYNVDGDFCEDDADDEFFCYDYWSKICSPGSVYTVNYVDGHVEKYYYDSEEDWFCDADGDYANFCSDDDQYENHWQPGKTYYITIEEWNKEYKIPVSVVCPKPAAPKVESTNALNGIQLSWNKIDGATKYVVYRRGEGQKNYTQIGTTTGTSFLDKGVTGGKYYCYTVRAFNAAGGYSDYKYANTSTRKYMATPKLTTIYNHQNGLAIKWNAVAGVTDGYRVYRRGAGQTTWTYLGTTKNTYYIDSAVKNKNGEYYRYTIIADGGYRSAFDANGLYLRRLANPTLNSATSSNAGITVKWGKVAGSSGYYVYRKTANTTWTRIAVVKGVNGLSYLDKTAKKGTTYTYTVRAVYGNTLSSYYSGISCKDKY